MLISRVVAALERRHPPVYLFDDLAAVMGEQLPVEDRRQPGVVRGIGEADAGLYIVNAGIGDQQVVETLVQQVQGTDCVTQVCLGRALEYGGDGFVRCGVVLHRGIAKQLKGLLVDEPVGGR